MFRLKGVRKADPFKRYKNFINTVADFEEVWLLDNGDGYATLDQDGFISLIVYPRKEDADYFSYGDTPVCVEVHEFLDRCKKAIEDETFRFAVYPNDKDVLFVTTENMIEDLTEELERME